MITFLDIKANAVYSYGPYYFRVLDCKPGTLKYEGINCDKSQIQGALFQHIDLVHEDYDTWIKEGKIKQEIDEWLK